MKATIKSYLKTLLHMVLAGFITNIVYIGCDTLFRAVVNDLSEEMSAARSGLYLLAMLGLQILYCFILIAFRYGNSREGTKRLVEDCRTEPYAGLWKDVKRLLIKEQAVLFTAMAMIILAMIQLFVPVGLSLTQLFIGIAGVSVFIPDLLLFLIFPDPTLVYFGAVMLCCVIGMLAGLGVFGVMYLGMLSRKRKKWCDEWKIPCA